MSKPHLNLLDGLRGMAAIIVLIFHIGLRRGDYGFPFGHLAVDFFFMLSGFVVAYSYEDRLSSTMNSRHYLALRLIRLYPLALAGMLMGLLITLVRVVTVRDITIAEFLSVSASSILLLPSFELPQYATAFPANEALWSIFFEIVISTVYLAFARQCGLAAILAMIVISGAALLWTAFTLGSLQYGQNKEMLYVGFFRVFFSFFVGVLIFRLNLLRLRRSDWLALGISALFCAALLHRGSYPGYMELAVVMLLFPALLLLASAIQVGDRVGVLFRALGILSYPLYAVHVPILRASAELSRRLPALAANPAVLISLEILVSVCVAVIAYRLYDVPVRRFLLRKARAGIGQPVRAAG